MAQTANEVYRDAALRHQIGVRRYTSGLTKKVASLLEEADRELVEKLRTRLARFEGKPLDFTGERWKALLDDVRIARAAVHKQYRDMTTEELGTLSRMEAERELSLLTDSVPINIEFAGVALETLQAVVSSKPFQGRLLKDWFGALEDSDQRRLQQALQLGMAQGEPIDDIVRRVIGTRKNNYADGILSVSRRDATAVVRTAVNHVSNSARALVWEENEDVITARIWVSTLDGRTSPVCQARDGRGTPTGSNELPKDILPLAPKDAKPPAHINCRSLMVAYIDGVGLLGNRPTVTDTRTRGARETDFRKIAKETGKPIQEVRKDWADKNIGRVPSATTYQEFLKRQTPEFQDDVLGKTKGKLFRDGDLTVDNFVDRAGNELSLKQLAKTHPEAFKKAFAGPATSSVDFADGTRAGEWHSASFAEAPSWLQERVARHRINDVTATSVDGAHFEPWSNRIEMDGRTETNPAHQTVWRHEYGHAMDYALREPGYLFRSQSPDYAKAQKADSKLLVDARKAWDAGRLARYEAKKAAGKEPLEVSSFEELSAGFKKAGINEKELDAFLSAHTLIGDLQGIGLRKRKESILSAWEDRDIQRFADALVIKDTMANVNASYDKGVLASLTDLTGATTKNKLCGYSSGYPGHSPAYYTQARKSYPEGVEGTEAFANLTSIAGAKETFAWKIVEHFFPSQAKLYLEIMK